MNSIRRIAMFTLATFGGSHKGGGERYVSELANAFRRRGVHVDVIAIQNYGTARYESSDGVQSDVSLRAALKIAQRSDIIHVHQLNSPGFEIAAMARLMAGVPIVLTDHGGGALSFSRAFGRKRLCLVDGAGYVSPWSSRDVDPHGIVACTDVIWGGGDHLPEVDPLPQRYDFGFVGRLLPHKGVHVLISALPRDASLIIAGQARDNEYFNELKRLAAGKNVMFQLDAPDQVVSSVHRSVGRLVLPSVDEYRGTRYARPELLGLVALEALAAGTPVIGSDIGGLGELLRSASQTWVQPGDEFALSRAMGDALSGASAAVSMDRYTWDAVATRCDSIFERVVDRRG